MNLKKKKDYLVPVMTIKLIDFADILTASNGTGVPDEITPYFPTSGDANQQDIYNIFPKGSGY